MNNHLICKLLLALNTCIIILMQIEYAIGYEHINGLGVLSLIVFTLFSVVFLLKKCRYEKWSIILLSIAAVIEEVYFFIS